MRQFLIGLAVAVPTVVLAVVAVVKFWKLALVGGTLLVVILVALVATVIAAMPLGYLLAGIVYYFRPEDPSTSTSYSIDQGAESGTQRRGSSDGPSDDQRGS